MNEVIFMRYVLIHLSPRRFCSLLVDRLIPLASQVPLYPHTRSLRLAAGQHRLLSS